VTASADDAEARLALFERSWIWQHGEAPAFIADAIIPEGGYAPLHWDDIQTIRDDRKAKSDRLLRTRIELALVRAGMTIEDLASRIAAEGHAAPALSIERFQECLHAGRNFTSLQLALIADATGVTVTWLLGGE
jgi:hypothetical protein